MAAIGRGHYCDNLVLRCMDFRFHAELPRLLAEHFGTERFEYDSPGAGGGGPAGSKAEATGAADGSAIRRQSGSSMLSG